MKILKIKKILGWLLNSISWRKFFFPMFCLIYLWNFIWQIHSKWQFSEKEERLYKLFEKDNFTKQFTVKLRRNNIKNMDLRLERVYMWLKCGIIEKKKWNGKSFGFFQLRSLKKGIKIYKINLRHKSKSSKVDGCRCRLQRI